jgi:beta-lactamase superfamily II metal-dependent hydrolase
MRKWTFARAAAALLLAAVAALVATPPAVAWSAQPAAAPASGPPAAGTFLVHAIDVGTGLSIFVEGHDFTLLYDAGSNDDFARGPNNRVLAFLHAIRPDLTSIDHVILSHPHKDHSELMPDVLATYRVRNVWNSGALNPICSYRNLLANTSTETGVAYHDALGGPGTYDAAFAAQTCYGTRLPATTIHVPRGTRMTQGLTVPLGTNAQMTILHADGSHQSSFNENSVVVRLDLGTRHILLPGDGEAGGRNLPTVPPTPSSVEGQLLACCAAALRSDILVAGHHGSKTSSRTAFLDAIGATNFIVSAGPTKYATVTLPDREVISEYARRGTVWRTDLNDATCRTNPRKIGPDNDGKPGGCDNILVTISPTGAVAVAYDRRAD